MSVELTDILSAKCSSHESIDNALRSYLNFTSKFKDEYLLTEYDVARCSSQLLQSGLFAANEEYVRRQIVYSLLQEDELEYLHIIASFLLFDGRQHEKTFEMMNSESSFPRLLELIKEGQREDPRFHRLLLELLYEMCRVQRLSVVDLAAVDDDFVAYLFRIIEELSDDVNDPYHYPVIRVLVSVVLFRALRLKIADFWEARAERAIHGGVYISKPWIRRCSPYQPRNKSSFCPRSLLYDLWRKHHLAFEPRNRNLPPAPDPQAPLPPLHHQSHTRILLHQRPPRTPGRNNPQPS